MSTADDFVCVLDGKVSVSRMTVLWGRYVLLSDRHTDMQMQRRLMGMYIVVQFIPRGVVDIILWRRQ